MEMAKKEILKPRNFDLYIVERVASWGGRSKISLLLMLEDVITLEPSVL